MNRMANNRETTRRSPRSVKRVDCSHMYRPNHYQNLSKLQMNRSKCNIKWQEPDQMSKDPTLQSKYARKVDVSCGICASKVMFNVCREMECAFRSALKEVEHAFASV
eukprot:432597_1